MGGLGALNIEIVLSQLTEWLLTMESELNQSQENNITGIDPINSKLKSNGQSMNWHREYWYWVSFAIFQRILDIQLGEIVETTTSQYGLSILSGMVSLVALLIFSISNIDIDNDDDDSGPGGDGGLMQPIT